jgi:hypothetical protein
MGVAAAEGRRIVSEEFKQLGRTEQDLATRRKSDPGKLALAARVRRETTLPLKTIAALAHLGTSKSANARLHEWMRGNPESKPQKMKR